MSQPDIYLYLRHLLSLVRAPWRRPGMQHRRIATLLRGPGCCATETELGGQSGKGGVVPFHAYCIQICNLYRRPPTGAVNAFGWPTTTFPKNESEQRGPETRFRPPNNNDRLVFVVVQKVRFLVLIATSTYHLQSDAHIHIRPKPPTLSTVVHRRIPRIEIRQRNAMRIGNGPTPVPGLYEIKLPTPAHHAILNRRRRHNPATCTTSRGCRRRRRRG